MRFQDTALVGAYIVELEKHEDDRGFFARSWCQREFEAQGLNPRIVQCNISFNNAKGTLRGMHYQVAPCAEVKLVRCTRGSIFDVIVDLRPGSPTYKKHFSAMLSGDNYRALYVPEGLAHGFQTLENNSEIFYQMSEFYFPQHQRGFRHNDPAFGIQWPIATTVMSDRDRNYPDFKD